MMLSVSNLSLSYGNDVIFKNLSFSINNGEIIVLKGPNGCGKTSLALCLTNLLNIETIDVKISGFISYDGKNVSDLSLSERCNSVGIIFQNPDNQIFSPLVIDELAFAPENLAIPRHIIKERIDYALKACQIEHLRNAKISELSGGEKQLVAIASVLTMSPKILIADEITARVDNEKKIVIRNVLKEYAAKGGGVVLITHDFDDLLLADNIIEMKRGKDYGNTL